MNNRPPISSSPASSINAYRKRRQRGGPNIVLILAIVLIVGGVGLLVWWLTSGTSNPVSNLFATETSTPTMTYTPTNTSTPTATATITETPTITVTPTFSTSFNYTVQDGDYLQLIVEKYSLGDDGVAWILLLNPYGGTNDAGFPIGVDPTTQNILPGQILLLPAPGAPLPTATLIPADLPRGTKLSYTVQSGDTLAGIAALFNSTEEDIIKENEIADASKIFVGQQLVIPANLITATPTRPPTSTPVTPGPGTALPTATMTPVN